MRNPQPMRSCVNIYCNTAVVWLSASRSNGLKVGATSGRPFNKNKQEKIMTDFKPIKLHISSTQTDGRGAEDSIEFYTEGRYYEEQGTRYLSYQETELSGMEGTTTVLEITGEEAALARSGAISSRMVFRTGCETESLYNTAYGVLDFFILTQKLDIGVCNGLIDSVYLKYRLRMGHGEACTTEMTIRVSYQE